MIRTIIYIVTLCASISCLSAQEAKVAPSTSGEAKLSLVEEGIFDLKVGKAIDLTDRKVLFFLRKVAETYADIVINGDSRSFSQGDRLDLKRNNSTTQVFKDKSECYIDYISFAIPKGAPALATFRFVCD